MPEDASGGEILVRLHPHARMRLPERGASEAEVVETVREGAQFAAKLGRTGFRRTFLYNREWRGKPYARKQIEAFAVPESSGWLVISLIVKYF